MRFSLFSHVNERNYFIPFSRCFFFSSCDYSFSFDWIIFVSVLHKKEAFSFWRNTVSIYDANDFHILCIHFYGWNVQFGWLFNFINVIVFDFFILDPKTRQIVQRKYMSSMVSKKNPFLCFSPIFCCCSFVLSCMHPIGKITKFRFVKFSPHLLYSINHNSKLASTTHTQKKQQTISTISHRSCTFFLNFCLETPLTSMINSSFLFLLNSSSILHLSLCETPFCTYKCRKKSYGNMNQKNGK